MPAPRSLLIAAATALAVGALAACSPGTNTTGEALTATGELVALSGGDGGATNACFTCHGLEGQGDGVSVPRLAGLDQGYLHKQMEDYATDLRYDPVMGPIARGLTPADRLAVSAWYSSMSADAEALTPPIELSLGTPDIYARGDASRGLQPCAVCHGASGEGAGPGQPALAGQPAAYTAEQLRRWKSADRRNDPRGLMLNIAQRLTEAEIDAIAAWLETRSPARPLAGRPVPSSASAAAAPPPAASRAGRHPDQ